MTSVRIFCPANLATGGTQLLHQLGAEMQTYDDIEVNMVYVPFKPNIQVKDPVPNKFKHFNIPYTINALVEPEQGTPFIIFPEVYANGIFLPEVEKYNKAIYWESVDNFFVKHGFDTFCQIPKNMLQLSQSEYSRDFLELGNFNNILDVGDFIDRNFLIDEKLNRDNIVLYNPTKDLGLSKILESLMPDVQFIPLVGYSKEQLIDLMSRAKLYIDFGPHPGKDRLPREAAAAGCCVIVGKIGSANYKADIPIDNKYKVDFSLTETISKIRYVLYYYDECIKDFEFYRNQIQQEEEKFKEEVRQLVEYCRGLE